MSEIEIVQKKRRTNTPQFGKRRSLDPENGSIRSRLLALVVTLLAIPTIGIFFHGIGYALDDKNNPDRAIPVVKAPEGPHVNWRAAQFDEDSNIFYAKVEGKINKAGWLGFYNTTDDCKEAAFMFQIDTNKVDNLDFIKGKRINASWNGETIQVKVGAIKKFPPGVAALMLVTAEKVNDILRIHKNDKSIEMKLLDTDGIIINKYFNRPTNFWSLIGMKDALAKMVGLCSLNTKEVKVQKKESKEKTKDENKMESEVMRL